MGEHVVFECERHDGIRYKELQDSRTWAAMESEVNWSEIVAGFFEKVTTSQGLG